MEDNQLPISDQKFIGNENLVRIDKEEDIKGLLHRSIVAISSLNKNKQRVSGSGVLISKDIVLTCAHNVFNQDQRYEYEDIKIHFGANGIARKHQYYAVENVRYLQEYKTCSVENKSRFDFALLKLSKQVPYKEFLKLSVPCQICLKDKNKQVFLQIFGFPGQHQQNYKLIDKYGNQLKLYQYGLALENRIIDINPKEYKICYRISTLPGQSGCPVVIDQKIIAVHVGGGKKNEQFNVGRLVDLPLFDKLEGWCKQLKGHPFQIYNKDLCPHLQSMIKDYLKEKHKKIKQKKLDLSEKKLGQIDVRKEVDLTHLQLFNNQLSAIDVTNNIHLTDLWLFNNQLSAIDVTNNIHLTDLWLFNNQLSAIDVTNNIHLTHLWLSNNQLSEIDVTNNIHLTNLYLQNNKLSAIDVTNNIHLTYLYLSFNQLSAIDVTNNIHLNYLWLFNNQLSAIDVANNIHLIWLRLQNNKLNKVSLSFSPQIPIKDYLDSSKFNFSDQHSDICEIQIHSKVGTNANQLKEAWTKMYQEKGRNKHGCKYVFAVVN